MGDKQVVAIENKLSDSTKLKAGIFFTVVSGISALVGFSATLAAAKRQDAKYFDKGIMNATPTQTSGVQLALRALGWGTLYAFAGTGILAYGIWKCAGVNNFEEFRYKVGSVLPKITKETPGERTQFDGLTDLLNYLQTRK
ncbi:transmembrane protein [Holotrichia oblita]|uniref:Transmembrane protein n=2 Tax=Holotrichia oblita TaxID=644536 RepID=A0ACB9TEC3_HOLOL|nr:transmembrane protein [Holotrichia oblita]KAI4465060.1 transmembrane protein [Holotrichia oblita]